MGRQQLPPLGSLTSFFSGKLGEMADSANATGRRSVRIERDRLFAADMELAMNASLGENIPRPNPPPPPANELPIAQVQLIDTKEEEVSNDKEGVPVGVVVAEDKPAQSNSTMPPVAPAGAAEQAPAPVNEGGEGETPTPCELQPPAADGKAETPADAELTAKVAEGWGSIVEDAESKEAVEAAAKPAVPAQSKEAVKAAAKPAVPAQPKEDELPPKRQRKAKIREF